MKANERKRGGVGGRGWELRPLPPGPPRRLCLFSSEQVSDTDFPGVDSEPSHSDRAADVLGYALKYKLWKPHPFPRDPSCHYL